MKLIEMRGQVSLEFLFIFAACLSVLAVLFTGFNVFLDAGKFFLELKSAQSFSEKFEFSKIAKRGERVTLNPLEKTAEMSQ